MEKNIYFLKYKDFLEASFSKTNWGLRPGSGKILENIIKAFFLENVRIFLIIELQSSIYKNINNFFQGGFLFCFFRFGLKGSEYKYKKHFRFQKYKEFLFRSFYFFNLSIFSRGSISWNIRNFLGVDFFLFFRTWAEKCEALFWEN